MHLAKCMWKAHNRKTLSLVINMEIERERERDGTKKKSIAAKEN